MPCSHTTHAEAQGYLTRSRFLHQRREAGAELGELIAVAVTSLPAPAPSIESFIGLYSRFLGSRHVYSLVQDDQNTRIIVANLSSDRFTTIDILFDAIDQIVEFSARRCFRLFQLASKSNVSFSLERYNALVRELDGSVAKRITRISSRGLRCVPRTSPVASIRRCGITANKSGDFR